MKDIVIIDLETTGTDIASDRIVQIACMKTSGDFKRIDEIKKYLINPGIPIPKSASDVHGITDEMVVDQLMFKDRSKGMFEYLRGCDILGFNSNRFDIPLLAEEFLRVDVFYKFPEIGTNLIDGMHIYHQMEKRDLTSAYKFYCKKELKGAHDAGNDILATFEIFKAQLKKYKELKKLDSKGLHDFCGGNIRVDLAGTMIINDEGIVVYAIGKDKGKSVVENPGFAHWMYKTTSFCSDTKSIIKRLLNLKY